MVSAIRLMLCALAMLTFGASAAGRLTALKATTQFEYGATAAFYASPVYSGACGYGNTSVPASPYGIYAAAVSPKLYQNAAACGECLAVACDRTATKYCRPGAPQVIITVANLCPQGSRGGHCDGTKKGVTMTPQAWSKLGSDVIAGVLPVGLAVVSCPSRIGGISFTVAAGSNPWYLALVLQNVGGPGEVSSVEAKVGPSGAWTSMARSWGSVWALNGVANQGKPVSIRVASGGSAPKQTVTAAYVIPSGWSVGTTYKSTVNFK